MSSLRLILASLKHHVRMHLAVALGVMAATTVLTGALLVGDSVRGSLRHLTLDRLGRIDEVLIVEQFFREELAEKLAEGQGFGKHFTTAESLILMQGTVEKPDDEASARANQVTILGCEPSFWKLGEGLAPPALGEDQIVLNEPLAAELGAQIGDELLIRIPQPSDVPSDSPLGKKTDIIQSRRLEVSQIIPAEGLGRFGLRPSQQLPLVAYVAKETLQDALDQTGKVNAILVAGSTVAEPSSEEGSDLLAQLLHPTPADLGLTIKRVRIGSQEQPVSDYFNISSDRMMLPEVVVNAAQDAFGKEGLQPVLTYLANTIVVGEKKIPYSTVTGIDARPPLGPYTLEGEPLADDQVVLNRWAADDLGAKVGDEVSISYYEPESTHGTLTEPPAARFKLRAIVPLSQKGEPPTQANDPDLTPELKGVTDQESIDDWDLPFELVEEIRDQDDVYWQDHRTTPKAFMTLATARRLWASRFGDTTSLRIPAKPGMTPETVFQKLDLHPKDLGFEFLPVKRQALMASAGTTPFNLLFLGFSFFIIAAAVMLVALLFRLGVEQRATEIGIESAVGLTSRKVARMLAGEGLVVSAVGALLGVIGGVGYAWLMLAGLRTWWLAAVSTPFLQLHVSPTSLVSGYLIGVVVSLLTILWTLRRMRRISVRRLLSGQANEESLLTASESRLGNRASQGMLLVALLLGLVAMQLGGEAQAGAFFGSGSLVLGSLLTLIWTKLRSGGESGGRSSFGLQGLAFRNASRNPGRSTLTIGLVAAACFLIVAISAFRLDTTSEGAGSFALVAESDQPIIHDLNTPEGRDELGFSEDDSLPLEQSDVYSLRTRSGDDASCLNLYQPRQPRVLGVSQRLINRGGFSWAGTAAQTPEESANPWLLLDRKVEDGAIPMVLDMNTAMYSLHLMGGVGSIYEMDDGDGGTIRFQVVGLLKNSLLQGNLLISEQNFLREFPQTAGYRFFLIDVNSPDAKSVTAVQQSLETGLGDWGLDAVQADERLASFLAVQNTYLSTFQSLGALGLLLGTFGLATVQLRNVFERRGELALMRATGFRRGILGRLVMLENVILLIGGLGTGVLAALVAILPHMLLGGAAIPWQSLTVTLILVLVVGLLAGMTAVQATLRAPLLAALRGE